MVRGRPGRNPRAHPWGAAMPYAYVEIARFELACFAVGAALGLIVAIVRGERRG